MKTKRKRPSTQKMVVRALLKQMDSLHRLAARAEVSHDGARFVQCWAVYGRPVTQALDANGQVWELHTVMDQATKAVKEQYWTPLGMERRNGGA